MHILAWVWVLAGHGVEIQQVVRLPWWQQHDNVAVTRLQYSSIAVSIVHTHLPQAVSNFACHQKSLQCVTGCVGSVKCVGTGPATLSAHHEHIVS